MVDLARRPARLREICLSLLCGRRSSEVIDQGANIEPKAINNAGVVVRASNTDQYPSTAFRWSSAHGYDLIDGTSANAVNEAGQIVGSTITGAVVLDGDHWNVCDIAEIYPRGTREGVYAD